MIENFDFFEIFNEIFNRKKICNEFLIKFMTSKKSFRIFHQIFTLMKPQKHFQ